MNDRYLIYLTGRSKIYSTLQENLQSIYPCARKSSLGMHCTIFPFYSKSDEDALIKEFNKMTSLQCVSVSVEDTCLFDNESIVLKLIKTSVLEKIHYDSISNFVKYEYAKGTPYIGKAYSPHLTIGHVSGIISLKGLSNDFNVKGKIITLDKMVLARRREEPHQWKTLAEKTLETE